MPCFLCNCFFSPVMGAWGCFFSLVFTSTASCGPSSSDHSSWGGPTYPFSHEPQHRHTVHRHGEVPLQRENWKSKREECEECELTATFVNQQNSSLWNSRITLRYHMTGWNSSTFTGIRVFVSVCWEQTCSSSVRGTSASGCMGSSCRIAANSLSCISSGT